MERAISASEEVHSDLLVILPHALFLVAVRMYELAHSCLLVIKEGPNVCASVCMLKYAFSVALVVLPFTCAAFSVWPGVRALSMASLVEPISYVDVSVGINVSASTSRLALSVPALSDGRGSREEDFDASTVGLPVGSLAYVEVSIAEIQEFRELHRPHSKGARTELPVIQSLDFFPQVLVLTVVDQLLKW